MVTMMMMMMLTSIIWARVFRGRRVGLIGNEAHPEFTPASVGNPLPSHEELGRGCAIITLGSDFWLLSCRRRVPLSQQTSSSVQFWINLVFSLLPVRSSTLGNAVRKCLWSRRIGLRLSYISRTTSRGDRFYDSFMVEEPQNHATCAAGGEY